MGATTIQQGTIRGAKADAVVAAVPLLVCFTSIICIPAMILNIKNRNYSVIVLLSWLFLLNLMGMVNALIWRSADTTTWWSGEGLCDVEVKLFMGSYVAVPGALVCLFRKLAAVLHTNCSTLVPSRTQRRIDCFFMVLFYLLVPLIQMVTSYIVQSQRYAIYELSGCINLLDQSWLSIVLFYIWPVIICVIAMFYCCLVLFRLYRNRAQFGEILRSSGSSWTKSRFFRLFFLSLVILLAATAFQTYTLCSNILYLLPYFHAFSWETVHGGGTWGWIFMIATQNSIMLDRWIPIIGCFVIFLFTGLSRDAIDLYRSMILRLGLYRCFSCLFKRRDSVAGSSNASNARLFSERKWPFISRSYVTKSPESFDTRYRDCEHQGTGISGQPEAQQNQTPWPKAAWNSLKRSFTWSSASSSAPSSAPTYRSSETPLPMYHQSSAPLTTVSTNAWGGRSQNGNSFDDGRDSPLIAGEINSIQVKQMISQTTESTRQNV